MGVSAPLDGGPLHPAKRSGAAPDVRELLVRGRGHQAARGYRHRQHHVGGRFPTRRFLLPQVLGCGRACARGRVGGGPTQAAVPQRDQRLPPRRHQRRCMGGELMAVAAPSLTNAELKYGLISVDDHVVEPPDLWSSRVPGRLKDRAPRLVRQQDGSEQWVLDGRVLLGGNAALAAAFTADRNREPARWDEVPPAAFVPAERLKAMDAAGVDRSVLYPSVAGIAGEAFGSLTDPELELACVQAYNDWLIDEWAATSERFIPQCIVPIWPPEATVREIRRAVQRGHRGVVWPSLPMDLRDVPHVSEPEYDAVWSVCEELGVPLCLHAGASPGLQYPGTPSLTPTMAAALDAATKPVSSVYVLGLYVFSRILMRHPNLRVIMAESALSWGMLYLEW